MPKTTKPQETETAENGEEPSAFGVVIALPSHVWDEITAHLRRDVHASCLPLTERVLLFIDRQVRAWRRLDHRPLCSDLDDLDHDVPF